VMENFRCKDCCFLKPKIKQDYREVPFRCELKPKLKLTGIDGGCEQFKIKDHTEERILGKSW